VNRLKSLGFGGCKDSAPVERFQRDDPGHLSVEVLPMS
jgi:hypothetical protein